MDSTERKRFPESARATASTCASRPLAHTHNSYVETAHRPEEGEFFDLQDFSRREEFLPKVRTCYLYFKLVPPNSLREVGAPRKSLSGSLPLGA
jgi:hypothetical protein